MPPPLQYQSFAEPVHVQNSFPTELVPLSWAPHFPEPLTPPVYNHRPYTAMPVWPVPPKTSWLPAPGLGNPLPLPVYNHRPFLAEPISTAGEVTFLDKWNTRPPDQHPPDVYRRRYPTQLAEPLEPSLRVNPPSVAAWFELTPPATPRYQPSPVQGPSTAFVYPFVSFAWSTNRPHAPAPAPILHRGPFTALVQVIPDAWLFQAPRLPLYQSPLHTGPYTTFLAGLPTPFTWLAQQPAMPAPAPVLHRAPFTALVQVIPTAWLAQQPAVPSAPHYRNPGPFTALVQIPPPPVSAWQHVPFEMTAMQSYVQPPPAPQLVMPPYSPTSTVPTLPPNPPPPPPCCGS